MGEEKQETLLLYHYILSTTNSSITQISPYSGFTDGQKNLAILGSMIVLAPSDHYQGFLTITKIIQVVHSHLHIILTFPHFQSYQRWHWQE